MEKKKYLLGRLKGFGFGIKYVLDALNSIGHQECKLQIVDDKNSQQQLIYSGERIYAIFPNQELPEAWNDIYEANNICEWDIKQFIEILSLFKNGKFKVYVPKGEYPMLIESDDIIVALAPKVVYGDHISCEGCCHTDDCTNVNDATDHSCWED